MRMAGNRKEISGDNRDREADMIDKSVKEREQREERGN
jgi:hypothetical protein